MLRNLPHILLKAESEAVNSIPQALWAFFLKRLRVGHTQELREIPLYPPIPVPK